MLADSKMSIQKATEALEQSASELEDGEKLYQELLGSHKDLLSWAEMYDSSDLETKKMIVSQIIRSVYVTKGYDLDIHLNINYQTKDTLPLKK